MVCHARAGHVRDLVESHVGGLDDGCEYNGHTFAGTITLELADDASATRVVVDHTYERLTNGAVSLSSKTGCARFRPR